MAAVRHACNLGRCANNARRFRQESKAGLAVGKLRQHASKEVSDLAKEVVRKWKQEVEKEKQAAGGSKANANGKSSAPAPGKSFGKITVSMHSRSFGVQCLVESHQWHRSRPLRPPRLLGIVSQMGLLGHLDQTASTQMLQETRRAINA